MTELLAPNGKPSNLTPEQYKLVRTPAFKEWFGDWEKSPETASKVVDENNEPLVVYHGSNNRFNKFNLKNFGRTDNGYFGVGFYFTPQLDYAEYYGKSNPKKKQIILECFLNIRNPTITFTEKDWVRNYSDGLLYFINFNNVKYLREVLALKPNQIKLADGTNTTFDSNNPDIRFEEGGLIAPNGKQSGLYFTEIYNLVRTKEFKEWFGDWEEAYKTKNYEGVSKIIDENGEPLICVHNTPNEFYEFDEYEIGRNTDAGYYGKGFYFTPNVGQSNYGEIELNCFLNIKNPYFKQASFRNYELKSDELKNQGYDGVVVYPNWIESFNFENGVDGCEEVVAYYPEQIKLGDGRNTTFDNYNSDIRFEEGGEAKRLSKKEKQEIISNQNKIWVDGLPTYKLSSDGNWVMKLDSRTNKYKTYQRFDLFNGNILEQERVMYARENSNKVFEYLDSNGAELLNKSIYGSRYYIYKNNYIRVSNHHNQTQQTNKETGLNKYKPNEHNFYSYEKDGWEEIISEIESLNNPDIRYADGGEIQLKLDEEYKKIMNDENNYPFLILNENGEEIGRIDLMYREDLGGYKIHNSSVKEKGKGIGKKAYLKLRQILGKPIISDSVRSEDAENLWKSLERNNLAFFDEKMDKYKMYKKGGKVIVNPTEIECHTCHWKWEVKDGGDDLFICHKCYTDNSKYYKFEGLEGQKILDTISFSKGGGTMAKTYSPNNLYHFTSLDALKGILQAEYIEGYEGSVLDEEEGATISTTTDKDYRKKQHDINAELVILLNKDEIVKQYEVLPIRDYGYEEMQIRKFLKQGYSQTDAEYMANENQEIIKTEKLPIDFIDSIIFFKSPSSQTISLLESKKIPYTENDFKKGGRTISQTPAPKKDQIKGSDKNKEGSAKDISSAKKIKFSDDVLEKIQNSVDKHNKKHPNKKITLDSAKAVVRRGMGAYSSTHRPTISGGNENSRVAWGLARLNAFVYKIVNGKSKSGKYSQDNDLIEELGYKVEKYEIGGIFQGTPHDFNVYSTEYIGTGEGLQLFGWGLYFTDIKDIAKNYAKNEMLIQKEISSKSDNSADLWIYTNISDNVVDKLGYLKIKLKEFEELKKEYKKDIWDDKIDSYSTLIDIIQNYQGKIYSVTLFKGEKETDYHLIKWENPLIVDDLIKIFDEAEKIGGIEFKNGWELDEKYGLTNERGNKITGEEMYFWLSKQLGGDKEASLFLLRAGIDGIKYKAGTLSRMADKEGYNYVIFDSDDVTIERKEKYADGGEFENVEFENSALFFGGFFTGIQRQGIGKSIIYDIFKNNPKLENILLYTQQDAIGFWQKLGGEVIKQGKDKNGVHRYYVKINRNSITKSKNIKELGVSYKNIETKKSEIDKGEYSINYGRQKIGFFFVNDLGTIKTDPKDIILYSSNEENYSDGGDIQAYQEAMGISKFKEGGETKPKKVYVSIKLPHNSKKIAVDETKPFSFNSIYYNYYDEETFEELKNGKLKGLVGVSTSPNNIAEWFIHRDCLIVMGYEEFMAINETETINYYDPYQLMKNNLYLFKRLYANITRYGEQEGSYVFTQTLVKILEKIIREINLEMNLAEGQKSNELYRISRFLSPYETSAFPDWIEKNKIKIESPIDLTNAILDFNKLNENASYIGNGFENPVLTFDELLPIVEKGVTNASSIYDSEQEIVLTNRELNIPKNSQLFFIDESKLENYTKSNRDEFIEKYKLKELYKVYYVQYKEIEKYRAIWLKKEEEKFNKKLEQGREELELKKDRVLDELLNYFLEKSINYVKNVLEKEILDYYETLNYYDEVSFLTDDNYIEQSLFSIPLVNSIMNTYEFIIKNFWKASIQKKKVENLDLYAFMRYYSDVESEIKKYFENNSDELEKLNNYRNTRGGGSLDAYRFERLLLKTINDYEKLPELIDYNELAKMYLDKMGGEIYRYYDKKDLQLISKYKDGGSVLLAPNGKPSNLTPEQYKLVRTPAFKKWFGDWENSPENASKVVDKNGEPLVVYHGSKGFYDGKNKQLEDKDITQFSSERLIFTTDNIDVAKYFGDFKQYFVNIKKPFIIDDGYNVWERLDEDYLIKKLGKQKFIEIINQEYGESFTYDEWLKYVNEVEALPISIDVVSVYIKKNKYYDGVIAFDIQETTNHIESNDFICFNPNEIKLADGTNTEFDGNNPDIRYSDGGLIAPNGIESNLSPEQYKLVRTPAFKKWFGNWEKKQFLNKHKPNSTIYLFNTISLDENGEPRVWCRATHNEYNVIESEYVYLGAKKSYVKQYGKPKEFFVKANKTIFIDNEDIERKKLGITFDYLAEYISDENEISRAGENYEKLKDKFKNQKDVLSVWEYFTFVGNEEIIELFKGWFSEYGFDSIMYWETGLKNNFEKYPVGLISLYFGNEYLKLADGTNTTFDTNNADIRFANGGKTEELNLIKNTKMENEILIVDINMYHYNTSVNFKNKEIPLKLNPPKNEVQFIEWAEGNNFEFEQWGDVEMQDASWGYTFEIPLLKYVEYMKTEIFYTGGELKKGIKTEMEHEDTLSKIKTGKFSVKKGAEMIAKDHLEENDKYYTHLEKMESKFEDGGKVKSIHSEKGDIKLSLDDDWYSDDTKVELVPVSELIKFREYDRKVSPKYNQDNSRDNINHLKFMFQREGVKSPLIIEYSAEDNAVLIIEGNHRLNSAIDLGMEYLPARVVLKKYGTYSPAKIKNAMQVNGIKANSSNYIPSDLKPSQIGIAGAKPIAYAEGGIIEGRLHSECGDDGCGRKFQVGENGHIIEAERDEAVIVADAFNETKEMTIEGTPSEIASALNVIGGGKNFNDGAKIVEGTTQKEVSEIETQATDTDVDDVIDSGSIIINRRSMADEKSYKVTGSAKQIASAINSINGNGVVIEKGAIIE